MSSSQGSKSSEVVAENWRHGDDQSADLQPDQTFKNCAEILLGGGVNNLQPQAEGSGGRLQVPQLKFIAHVGRIDKNADIGRRGRYFVQEFESLRPQ